MLDTSADSCRHVQMQRETGRPTSACRGGG